MIRAGYLALRRIANFSWLPFDDHPQAGDPISIQRQEVFDAWDRLAAAGVPLKKDRDAAWIAFAGWRVNYDTVLLELAALMQAPPTPWTADRSPVVPSARSRRATTAQEDEPGRESGAYTEDDRDLPQVVPRRPHPPARERGHRGG